MKEIKELIDDLADTVEDLTDMCNELDAKFSDLKTENKKLRSLVRALSSSLSCEHGWCSGKCEEILGCTDLNYCVADRIMAECMMKKLWDIYRSVSDSLWCASMD